MAYLSYKVAPLVRNGSSNGVLTVSSTEGMAKGATVFLAAKGRENKQLIIEEISSGTSLVVREPSGYRYTMYDCSGYTLELKPQITQPDQHSVFEPQLAPMASASNDVSLAIVNTIEILSNRVDALERQLAPKRHWFLRLIDWLLRRNL